MFLQGGQVLLIWVPGACTGPGTWQNSVLCQELGAGSVSTLVKALLGHVVPSNSLYGTYIFGLLARAEMTDTTAKATETLLPVGWAWAPAFQGSGRFQGSAASRMFSQRSCFKFTGKLVY